MVNECEIRDVLAIFLGTNQGLGKFLEGECDGVRSLGPDLGSYRLLIDSFGGERLIIWGRGE